MEQGQAGANTANTASKPVANPYAVGFDDIDDKSRLVPNGEKKGNIGFFKSIAVVEVGKEGKKQEVIEALFEEEETNAYLSVKLFFPKLEDPDDKKKVQMYRANRQRIVQFFNSYSKDGLEINTKGMSFNNIKEMYDFFMTKITPDFAKVKTRIKAVYDSEGKNVELAKVGDVFSTSIRKRVFEWDDQYDFVVKPSGGKKPNTAFGGGAGGSDDDNDI